MKAYVFPPNKHGKKARIWSCRIRLGSWDRERTFPFHVTDKRVAEQKMRALISELEREEAGIAVPRVQRDAAQKPLAAHLKDFLAEMKAEGRAPNTLGKYRHAIGNLCRRCRWVNLRDVTLDSFCTWRASSALQPKTVNDALGAMRSLLHWLERRQLVAVDPLKHVSKIPVVREVPHRRALSVEEVQRLVLAAPRQRGLVYLTAFYLGLRRAEMAGLKWGDFKFNEKDVWLRVPATISKNRRESVHLVHPALAEVIRIERPVLASVNDLVFAHGIPRVPIFKGDLEKANIPFLDKRGSRIDLHGLRHTFIPTLTAAGVAPYVASRLARHSDIRLTFATYTDPTQVETAQEVRRLPFLKLQEGALGEALPGVVSGPEATLPVAVGQSGSPVETADADASGHEKTAPVARSRFRKMVGAERFELSTSWSQTRRSTRLSYTPNRGR